MDKKPKKVRPKEKEQIEKFKAKAKELGVDESGEAMERAFKSIVRATPKSAPKKPAR